jgi:hypothetical protein
MTTTSVLNDLRKRAMYFMQNLPKTTDSIAVQLYRDGVRNAKCGDARKCAIAQYIANKLDHKGAKVYVGGMGASIYIGSQRVSLKFSKLITKFIREFDDEKYRFLMFRKVF